jgi:HAD superfamily hydrolase (TIGR01509 family)
MYGFASGDYKDIIRKLGLDDEQGYGILKNLWIKNLKSNKYGIRAYDGAEDFLKNCREDYEVMFATGSHMHQIRIYAKHVRLVDEILKDGNILTRDDVARPKPGQSHFVKCMKKMGSIPRETVVVDDMPENLVSAGYVGMKTVGVTWGFSSRKKFWDAGMYCVDTFDELKATIGRLV